ncbi:MAG: hypothetical protein LC118_02525 [Dehalococcoidia bacterium]|nr:hypothetical protein [Dehalococcoidia bacterium]
MQIDVEPREAVLLRSVLERYLGDLRSEIYKTENEAMRNGLKEDEATLKSLINRIQPAG